MVLSAQHHPYQIAPGKRVWHINSAGLNLNIIDGRKYTLVPAGKEDFQKVRAHYLKCPVPSYDIASVEIIHNKDMLVNFETAVAILNERAGNPSFEPKWIEEKHKNQTCRVEVYEQYEQFAAEHFEPEFRSVNFLPMWHGTREGVLDSLCRTGFANLALTDSGFFGKGIYSAHQAEYSWRVYSKGGPLVYLWNACFSAYPVIDGDMQELTGKGNYRNHDAHFIPVVHDPNDQNKVVYIPCKKGQAPTYHELVVFERAQCFPRFIVRLQAILKKEIKPAALPQITSNFTIQYQKAKSLHEKKEYGQAFKDFFQLAEEGFDKGQYCTGVYYYYGYGQAVDYVKAVLYFELAATQNNANALYMIGYCYYKGRGYKQDLELAEYSFIKAANHGSSDAKKILETDFKKQLNSLLNDQLTLVGKYCYDNFLSKKYKLSDHDKFPSDGTTIDGQIVERPNHGLANTLRKIYYFSAVVEIFKLNGISSFSFNNVLLDIKSETENILTAFFFSLVGRESEISFKDDYVTYTHFKEASANAYVGFIQNKPNQYKELISSDKIIFYRNLIKNPHASMSCIVSKIYRICHNLDLFRCYGEKEFDTALESIKYDLGIDHPNTSTAILTQLQEYAKKCIEATGDQNLVSGIGRNGKLFVACSTSIETCSSHLNKVSLPDFFKMKAVVNQAPVPKQIQGPPVNGVSNFAIQYDNAMVFYAKNDYANAFAEFSKLAKEGFDKGQYWTGLCYYKGEGTDVNYQKAVHYFNLASEKNNADALYMLGCCYHDGKGCKKDLELSKKYFKEAAKQGSPQAKQVVENQGFRGYF